MTKVLKIIAIVLAVGFLVNTYSSCTLSKKLKEAENAYVLERLNANEQKKIDQKLIAKLQGDRLEKGSCGLWVRRRRRQNRPAWYDEQIFCRLCSA